MERHRLFRLDASLTLMGFEVDDWAVLLGSWTVLLQVLGVFLSARPRLVLATALAGFAFLAYRRVKDRVPGKFGRHLLGYVVEADDYRVVPDEVNIPYHKGGARGGCNAPGFSRRDTRTPSESHPATWVQTSV